MKTILTVFIALFAFFANVAYSEESRKEEVNAQFPYISLGLGPAPFPLPIFGGGYRAQWDHYGLNGAINAATIYSATGAKASLIFDYYPKPNLASQFYFGIGPAVGVGFVKDSHKTGVGFASEFVFGKQYRNETGDIRFAEVTVDFPCGVSRKHGLRGYAIPIVIFNYGVGF